MRFVKVLSKSLCQHNQTKLCTGYSIVDYDNSEKSLLRLIELFCSVSETLNTNYIVKLENNHTGRLFRGKRVLLLIKSSNFILTFLILFSLFP